MQLVFDELLGLRAQLRKRDEEAAESLRQAQERGEALGRARADGAAAGWDAPAKAMAAARAAIRRAGVEPVAPAASWLDPQTAWSQYLAHGTEPFLRSAILASQPGIAW